MSDREVAGGDGRRLCAGHSAAVRDDRAQRIFIFGGAVEDDRLERDPLGTQALRNGRGVDEKFARAGIGDDEAHLVDGLGRVDRHRHAAREEDAEVREDPVDAVGRHQRNAIAGREPAMTQRCSDRRHTGQNVGAAECAPVAVCCTFVQDGSVGSGKRSANEIDERHEAPFVQNPKQAR